MKLFAKFVKKVDHMYEYVNGLKRVLDQLQDWIIIWMYKKAECKPEMGCRKLTYILERPNVHKNWLADQLGLAHVADKKQQK